MFKNLEIAKLFCIFAIKNKTIDMKVTLLKIAKNKEVINRLNLQALADLIRKNPDERTISL